MYKRFKIKRLNIIVVFRHKWDETDSLNWSEFRNYELGLFFRKDKIVGNKGFKNPKNWNNNLVGSYMFGIKLLICKMWIAIDYNGTHL